MDLVRRITLSRMPKRNFPEFRTGDTLAVYVKVKEGEKERVQLYTGVVVKTQGTGSGRTFTVRKISSGVGVERTFPYFSPAIDRVELISHGKVRRSRLFYLRGLKGRAGRLKSSLYLGDEAGGAAPGAADELPVETPPAAATPGEAKEAKESKKEAKKEAKTE
jgi:large subunit ribosomal protein L19